MSFSRHKQWYHSLADPIWPDCTFKAPAKKESQMQSGQKRACQEKKFPT